MAGVSMRAGVVVGLAMLALVGCRSDSAASGRWLDVFPAYPGARELCSQHVTGTVGHIIWTAYVTADEPERVGAFYLKAEGEGRAERDGEQLSFRHGDKVLSIHRASAKDYPDCGKRPGPNDKTVLIVSQAIGLK